jgi:protein-S-isoprenylcysteine O-methyltransferase Ste14
MKAKKTALLGVVVLYFVICLEILIMISPFAGFFYSVFNPVLLTLVDHPATRWLTAFFLPHMVVPTTFLLIAVRIAGSALFLGGLAIFLLCAGQIYLAKFRRRGAVVGGLYRHIRHPQYMALALAGAGLAILWPRLLTVALWGVMLLLYFVLARDEERRMVRSNPETYPPYMEKTGMFLPRSLENLLLPPSTGGRFLSWLLLCGIALGGAFWLRFYTIHHLTMWELGAILELPAIRQRLNPEGHYLVYFLPRDYVMQGMIADTGDDWRLYKHHHTLAMISDWVLHPFGHLRQGHHHGAGHQPGGGEATSTMADGVMRRLIFMRVEGRSAPADRYGDLGISVKRTPLFLADVEVHTAQLQEVRDLPAPTGWGRVPTPTF